MAQKIKCLTQLGATDFNNQTVDFGHSGSITIGSSGSIALGTGSLTSTGGSVTLGSSSACTAAIDQGSLTLGSGSHNVPLTVFGNITQTGVNIVPPSQYNIITSTTSPIPAAARGIIVNVDMTAAFEITFPTSPADGQLYSVSIVHSQTTYTMTSSDTMVPASITTTLGAGYTFMYDQTGTTWYLIA